MINKVSDFKIPYYLILKACEKTNSNFVDLDIKHEWIEDNKVGFNNGVLYVGEHENVSGVLWGIIFSYFNDFKIITGNNLFVDEKQKKNTFFLIHNFIALLCVDLLQIEDSKPTEPNLNRIYQYPLVWILMKDIICPAFSLQLENTQVVSMCSPFFNVSENFNSLDNVDKSVPLFVNKNIEYPFIILNKGFCYEPLLMSSLVISLLKSHNVDPKEVINHILNSFLKERVIGACKLHFKDELKVKDFIALLKIQSGLSFNIDEFIEDKKIKVAFTPNVLTGIWNYLGLIENMLEVVRHPRMEVHNSLELLRDELMKQIDKKRKEKGRDGLSYEALLRVKNKENSEEDYRTIESLLSSDRIW